jgi:archaellin
MLNATSSSQIDGVVIPLRAYGVKYIALGKEETAVTLTVSGNSYANIYTGTANMTKTSEEAEFKELLQAVKGTGTKANATLFIQNTNGDEALDSNEKGYLVIYLPTTLDAGARTHIVVEIKPEKAAPLTVDFYVPESMQEGWMTVAG